MTNGINRRPLICERSFCFGHLKGFRRENTNMSEDRKLIPPGVKSLGYLREMPKDHPLYKKGFIIGGRTSKVSSKTTKQMPKDRN